MPAYRAIVMPRALRALSMPPCLQIRFLARPSSSTHMRIPAAHPDRFQAAPSSSRTFTHCVTARQCRAAGSAQHDAHEFLCAAFDALEEEAAACRQVSRSATPRPAEHAASGDADADTDADARGAEGGDFAGGADGGKDNGWPWSRGSPAPAPVQKEALAAQGSGERQGDDSPGAGIASVCGICPIDSSFGFRVRTTLRCTHCGHSSSSVERFNHLSLIIPAGAASSPPANADVINLADASPPAMKHRRHSVGHALRLEKDDDQCSPGPLGLSHQLGPSPAADENRMPSLAVTSPGGVAMGKASMAAHDQENARPRVRPQRPEGAVRGCALFGSAGDSAMESARPAARGGAHEGGGLLGGAAQMGIVACAHDEDAAAAGVLSDEPSTPPKHTPDLAVTSARDDDWLAQQYELEDAELAAAIAASLEPSSQHSGERGTNTPTCRSSQPALPHGLSSALPGDSEGGHQREHCGFCDEAGQGEAQQCAAAGSTIDAPSSPSGKRVGPRESDGDGPGMSTPEPPPVMTPPYGRGAAEGHGGGGGGGDSGGGGGLRLTELLSRFFEDEPREWRCDECGRACEAAMASQRLLSPLPPNLLLHMKRFHSDAATGATAKLRTRLQVDERLRLEPHLAADGDNESSHGTNGHTSSGASGVRQTDRDGDGQPGGAHGGGGDRAEEAASSCADAAVDESKGGYYRLRALVSHHGSQCWSGHYTCVARLGESMQWASYDDSHVSLIHGDPTHSSEVMRGAYLLLYERSSEAEGASALGDAASVAASDLHFLGDGCHQYKLDLDAEDADLRAALAASLS